MVHYPSRPTLPPYLANATGRITFEPLAGTFLSKGEGGKAVRILRAKGSGWGVFEALLYQTPMNEDRDGAPESYAPPVSADDLSGLNGLKGKDDIRNATNERSTKAHPHVIFHTNGVGNTFKWTGVVSAVAGAGIDNRSFLRDGLGRFPVVQPARWAAPGFYKPQTATVTVNGTAVNPYLVPYAALGHSLAAFGKVSLGDVGLAIRANTGAAAPFVYADAGGGASTTVGEYSTRLIRDLFGGAASGEDIAFIVFPNSSRGRRINAGLIRPTVESILRDLTRFENPNDLVSKLLYPLELDPISAHDFLRTSPAFGGPARPGMSPPIVDAGQGWVPSQETRPDYQAVLAALRRFGLKS
jgi:hypothetical protein